MDLRYHDVSEGDERVTKIRKNREELWSCLYAKYKEHGEDWNIDEIESALQSLQEYFSLDYPENLNLSTKQYRRAIDNLARVAISFLDLAKGDKEVDKCNCNYATKKIMEIFYELGIK